MLYKNLRLTAQFCLPYLVFRILLLDCPSQDDEHHSFQHLLYQANLADQKKQGTRHTRKGFTGFLSDFRLNTSNTASEGESD